jgi:hypothetical protein
MLGSDLTAKRFGDEVYELCPGEILVNIKLWMVVVTDNAAQL